MPEKTIATKKEEPRGVTVDDLYPPQEGKWLKAEDLGTKAITLVISDVEMDYSLNNGKHPLVLSFEDVSQKLRLNATNARKLKELYGPYPQEWVGKEVTLGVVTVQFQGRPVKGIRILG